MYDLFLLFSSMFFFLLVFFIHLRIAVFVRFLSPPAINNTWVSKSQLGSVYIWQAYLEFY